jgi:hypothetical protein
MGRMITESSPIYDRHAQVQGMLDLRGATWERLAPKARIEIALVEHTDGVTYTAMRNSEHPDGTVLVFTPSEWDAFLLGARDGEFDGTW